MAGRLCDVRSVSWAILLGFCAGLSATEFRSFRSIPARGSTPEGTVAVKRFVPVDKEVVAAAVTQVLEAWNTPAFTAYVGEDFYDRTRFVDATATIPKDARLEVLSVSNIHLVNQYVRPAAEEGMPDIRITQVSVTARTQEVFNDPEAGYQRIEGTNEYIITVEEDVVAAAKKGSG